MQIQVYDDDWFSVSYEDRPEMKEELFNKVLEYFKKYSSFSGESICQSDNPIIYAPELLGQIADDIFKFEFTNK